MDSEMKQILENAIIKNGLLQAQVNLEMGKAPKDVMMKNGVPKMQLAVVTHCGYTRVFSYFVIKEISVSEAGQRIIIGYSTYLGGKFLIIDSEIQFTPVDFWNYSESFVYPAMILRKGDNVAAYGAGDGGLAKAIQDFGVTPTIVEWDNTVVDICSKHFSRLNGGSLKKSRIVNADVLKHEPKKKYNAIFFDLIDPLAGPHLYTPKAIRKICSGLEKDGIIVFYAERMMAKSLYAKIGKHFKYSCVYGSFMEFVGSLFTFCMFSNSPFDLEKVRKTEMSGEYFCGKHFHEIDLSKLKVGNFKETFSIVDV